MGGYATVRGAVEVTAVAPCVMMLAEMANQEHLDILEKGVETWNAWRRDHPHAQPDLSDADLGDADLECAILADAQLGGAGLSAATSA